MSTGSLGVLYVWLYFLTTDFVVVIRELLGKKWPHILTASLRSPITKALLKDNAIFQYATAYYYKHQYSNLSEFTFTDADYQEFRQYLDQTGFNYETETEKAFAKALEQAKKDELDESINTAYINLQKTITQAKNAELEEHQTEIKAQLIDEIVKRYFYRDGLYTYQIQNNKEIAEAVSVLGNSRRYTKILK